MGMNSKMLVWRGVGGWWTFGALGDDGELEGKWFVPSWRHGRDGRIESLGRGDEMEDVKKTEREIWVFG